MADYEVGVGEYIGFRVGRFGFGVVDLDVRKFALGCFVGTSRAELVRNGGEAQKHFYFLAVARAAGCIWGIGEAEQDDGGFSG